jgi:hypothetical protein
LNWQAAFKEIVMYLAEKIVFVELHKTGCTHIVRLLAETVDGKIIGKHNAPSPKLLNTSRTFIGSIRNPWEWYVSLWAYGCDKKGGVYNKVTKKNTLIKTCRDWFSDPFYSTFMQLNHISKNPEQWQRCYADANDPEAFRAWLHMMHDNRHWHDFGEGYGKYPMSLFAGLLSYRYLKLFCKNDFIHIQTLEELQLFEKNNCYINYFIHNENLEQDFFAALDRAGIELSEDKKNRVNSISRTNTSSKKHPAAYYYDAETTALVSQREQLIIDKFGYQAPVT